MRLIIVTILIAFSWASSLFAAPHVQADLVSETQTVQPGRPFWVAVRLRMNPGWHTYWKNPGDSGMATTVEWVLPQGFRAQPLEWPLPKPFGSPPLVSYGYSGEAWLMAKIEPPSALKPGTTFAISAQVRWLECADVCVPGRAYPRLELSVVSTPPKNLALKKDFDRARAQLPVNDAVPGWRVKGEVRGRALKITLKPAQGAKNPATLAFFSDLPGFVEASAPQTLSRVGGSLVLECRLAEGIPAPAQISGLFVSTRGWWLWKTTQGWESSVPIRRLD